MLTVLYLNVLDNWIRLSHPVDGRTAVAGRWAVGRYISGLCTLLSRTLPANSRSFPAHVCTAAVPSSSAGLCMYDNGHVSSHWQVHRCTVVALSPLTNGRTPTAIGLVFALWKPTIQTIFGLSHLIKQSQLINIKEISDNLPLVKMVFH